MQLGMIGLGRMGANMVRRLIKGGHECVVFDMSPKAVQALAKEKRDRRRVARRLREEAREAARDLADGAGGGRRSRRSPICCRCSKPGDILIDGGNSYYIDDIRRAKELAREGHPLRRRRHQRRRVGPRARLLHDDRRRAATSCSISIRSSRTLAPGIGDIARTPGREKLGGTAEHGYLHCGPNGAGHFVKMVHNGIEYGLMAAYAEGLGILRAANVGKQHARRRRRDDAAARSRALSIRPQPAPTSPRSGGAAA